MRALWLAVPLVLVAGFACGGGDGTTSTSSPSVTDAAADNGDLAFATPTSMPDELCPLLPESDVKRTTGYDLLTAQQSHGPGSLDFCTLYLDIPDCHMQCALSLEDMGPFDPNSYTTPDTFKSSLVAANPDANFTFGDGTFGPNSWLATAQSGRLPQWKVAYFQVNGVAFNLHSPLVAQYTLTETQVVDATKAVIANLNKSPLSS